ncbi:MAG: InlB B-repeat-containing protein [Sphaerochaetaceae bacterium]|nr:InlB B-repeat-containing protein [Sphaerochaetaceae bacterium]
MFKKLKSLNPFLLVFITFILFSCELPTQNNEVGNLTINFDSATSRDLIEPAIKMDIDSYLISGIGPDGRSFEPISSNGEAVTITDLYIGEWTITVKGLNEDNISIAEGTSTATIESGKTVSTNILVEEYTGAGTIKFNITWPASDLEDPQILATLTNSDSSYLEDLSLNIDSEEGQATLSLDVPSGYYLLNFNLYDGSTSDINNKLFGKTNSIRVVKDNSTYVTFETTSSDLNLYGDLSVSVDNNIISPFRVTVSPTDRKLIEGETQDFLANVDVEGEYTYKWYVDGIVQDSSSNLYTIPNDLSIGNHTIDVVAMSNGIISSASTTLIVKENSQDFVQVQLFNTATKNLENQFMLEYGVEGLEQLFVTYPDKESASIGNLRAYKATNPMYADEPNIIIFGFNQSFDIPDSNESWVPPEDFCQVQLGFRLTSEDPIELEDIESFFQTDCINDEYEIFTIDSTHSESRQVEIDTYGDVGEKLIGKLSCENCPLYGHEDFESSYQEGELVGYYDVDFNFNLTRGKDIDLCVLYFDSNGGSGYVNEIITLEGYSHSAPNPNYDLSRDGYTFDHWNTESDDSGTSYEIGDMIEVDQQEKTIYAIWEEDTL